MYICMYIYVYIYTYIPTKQTVLEVRWVSQRHTQREILAPPHQRVPGLRRNGISRQAAKQWLTNGLHL